VWWRGRKENSKLLCVCGMCALFVCERATERASDRDSERVRWRVHKYTTYHDTQTHILDRVFSRAETLHDRARHTCFCQCHLLIFRILHRVLACSLILFPTCIYDCSGTRNFLCIFHLNNGKSKIFRCTFVLKLPFSTSNVLEKHLYSSVMISTPLP
jgi:hypothetical protein